MWPLAPWDQNFMAETVYFYNNLLSESIYFYQLEVLKMSCSLINLRIPNGVSFRKWTPVHGHD